MTRHFGIHIDKTVRPALHGGNEQPAARQRETQNFPREPNQLATVESSGSLASSVGLGRTLPRQEEGASFHETMKDIIALFFAFLFVGSVSVAFTIAMFILLFVQT